MAEEIAQPQADVIVPKAGPALSATSDMPEVKPEPPPLSEEVNTKADLTAPVAVEEPAAPAVEAEKAEGEEGKTEDETGASETPGDDPAAETREAAKAKTPKGVQKRLDELTRREAEANRRADETKQSLDKALAAIENLSGKSASETTDKIEAETPRPKRESFDDPNAYETALIEWSAQMATKAATAEVEARNAEKAAADKKAADDKAADDQLKALQTSWTGYRNEAIEKFPDYEAVAESDDLKISMPMSAVILNAGKDGPAIAYALGKNPAEASRIASLPPQMAVFEMGKFAAAALAPPKPQISKTPPPIKPLKSNEPAAPKAPNEMSMDEYAAANAARVAGGRKPFIGGGGAKTH